MHLSLSPSIPRPRFLLASLSAPPVRPQIVFDSEMASVLADKRAALQALDAGVVELEALKRENEQLQVGRGTRGPQVGVWGELRTASCWELQAVGHLGPRVAFAHIQVS